MHTDDIHRSLRRYIAQALGSPPWTVVTQRSEVRDEDRPVALVEPTSPVQSLGVRTGIPQGNVLHERSFDALMYPAKPVKADPDDPDEPEPDEREARLIAAQVEARVSDAITYGLVGDVEDPEPVPPVPPENIGGPMILPIYDFEDVPVRGPARGGPDDPYDYMRVLEGWNVQRNPDPQDSMRWTVILNLRVRWDWPGRIVDPRVPIAASMPGTYTGP